MINFTNGQEAGLRPPLETAGGSNLERQEMWVQGLSSSPGEHANSGSLRNSTSPKPAVHFLYFSYRKKPPHFFFFISVRKLIILGIIGLFMWLVNQNSVI